VARPPAPSSVSVLGECVADTEKDDDGGLSASAWTGIVGAFLVAAAAFTVRRWGAAQQ